MNCGRLPTTETTFTGAGDYWPRHPKPVVVRPAWEDGSPHATPPVADQVVEADLGDHDTLRSRGGHAGAGLRRDGRGDLRQPERARLGHAAVVGRDDRDLLRRRIEERDREATVGARDCQRVLAVDRQAGKV